MAEVVASQYRTLTLAAPRPDLERLREQVADFEQLVEAMLEQNQWMKNELDRLREENRKLQEENERLR